MHHDDNHFAGFQPLDANFIYTPNQFLDICIPNSSLVAVRAISHVLYETHRWRNDYGQLEKPDVKVPQSHLEQAGVSRSCRTKAIEEGIAGHFLHRVQGARRTSAEEHGQSEILALNWDDESPYVSDAASFHGFFSGDGHRTPLPEAFYTTVIPTQPLNVVKWVAAVFRYSVGYQDQFGRRREKAKVSTRFVEQYANIKDHKNGIRGSELALERGFIVKLEEGNPAKQLAPTYGPKWLTVATKLAPCSKRPPACSENPPAQFDSPTGTSEDQPPEPVQNSHQVVCEKNTTIKKAQKETCKQQQENVVADDCLRSVSLLTQEGIAEDRAAEIASTVPLKTIERQVEWLKHRTVKANRAGFLIAACLHDYPKPEQLNQPSLSVESAGNQEWRQDEALKAARLKRFHERRDALLPTWQASNRSDRERWRQLAADRATDSTVKMSIRLDGMSEHEPHRCILDEMALDLKLEPITPGLQALPKVS